MKLAIVKSENMTDWYVIEKASHDGRMWLEPTGDNGFALGTSSRFSDADVEVTLAEMKAIAQAIRERGSAYFKRCSVDIQGNVARFSSPRNSLRDGVCSLDEADELAAQIEALNPDTEAA